MGKGFFAYGSQYPSSGESIENAIREINKADDYNITSWRDLQINGNFIVSSVCEAITDSDFFCADLTGVNDNVLFEIGYAIGIGKKIWLINDTSLSESSRAYKEFDILTTIGYSGYTNSDNIVNSFYKDQPNTIEPTLNRLTKTLLDTKQLHSLLFLKNQVETNISFEFRNSINDLKIKTIIDDAVENKVQPFSWYLQNLISLPGVLIEFSSEARSGFEIQNHKASLIAGLSLGLGCRTLLVCEEPYRTPLDFKDLLKTYRTVSDAGKATFGFLEKISHEQSEIREQKARYLEKELAINKLQRIDFGEFQAEHEKEKISEYYLETTAYETITKNEYNVVVGRKGPGKSATLYYLRTKLSGKAEAHICVLRPFNFDLDGILYVPKNVPPEFLKTNLIETVWKLVIYTEVCLSLYDELQKKDPSSFSETEKSFVNDVEANKKLFERDYHERINEVLEGLKENQIEKDMQIKVSEALHSDKLPTLRSLILKLLAGKKLYLLIDNLDKSWRKGENLDNQSHWLFGLLGLTGKLVRELTGKKDKGTEFHLITFLRSDIFNYGTLRHAREPDKIKHVKLRVDDKETLFRIIEQRFFKLNELAPECLWEDYMPDIVAGQSVQDYVFARIVPRPRDIIYFFNKMKEKAVMRGHEKVMENDVIDAFKEYSEWLLMSLLVENGVTIKQLEDFVYELIGEKPIINDKRIEEAASSAGISFNSDYALDDFIDHLVMLSLLGRETKSEIFTFIYQMENDKKSKALFEKLGTRRFILHRALEPALELEF